MSVPNVRHRFSESIAIGVCALAKGDGRLGLLNHAEAEAERNREEVGKKQVKEVGRPGRV